MTIQDDRKTVLGSAAALALTAGIAMSPDFDMLGGRATMTCKGCGRKFKTTDALKRHVKTKHKAIMEQTP